MRNLKYVVIVAMVALMQVNTEASAQLRIFGKKKKNTYEQQQPVSQSVEAQMMNAYSVACAQRDALAINISNLTLQMNQAKKSKAKKLGKQLVAAQGEYDALQRIIGTFPQSLTNPSMKAEVKENEDELFRREMDRKFEEKVANADIERAIINDITDPELKRAYEKYQRSGGEQSTTQNGVNERLYYSVQIGSGRSGQASTFRGLTTVYEKGVSGGNSVYYIGKFATEAEAKRECDRVRQNTRYRDAFVIAFADNNKISLTQARQMNDRY